MKRLYQFILVVTALLLFVTGLTAGCRNEVNVSGQGSKTETNVKTANKIDDDKAAAEKRYRKKNESKPKLKKPKKRLSKTQSGKRCKSNKKRVTFSITCL